MNLRISESSVRIEKARGPAGLTAQESFWEYGGNHSGFPGPLGVGA